MTPSALLELWDFVFSSQVVTALIFPSVQVSLRHVCQNPHFEDSSSSRHSDLFLQVFVIYIDDCHVTRLIFLMENNPKIASCNPNFLVPSDIYRITVQLFLSYSVNIISALTERRLKV